MTKHDYFKAIEGITDKFAKTNPTLRVVVDEGSNEIRIKFNEVAALRDKWVLEKLGVIRRKEALGDFNYEIVVNDPKRKIMVVNFYELDIEWVYVGVALCSPNDVYNEDVGLAVAYAKAMGEYIPDYI